MSVQARFRLADADRTELTMEITMSLAEWKALRTALDSMEDAQKSPFWTLRHRILALVDFAHKHFKVSADDEAD